MKAPYTTLAEVAAILAGFGSLDCSPTIDPEREDGVRLVVDVVDVSQETSTGALATHALRAELDYLSRLAQVRAFARDYGIDPASLGGALVGPTPIAAGRRTPVVSGVGTAAIELDAIVAQLVAAQRDGRGSSDALDAVYSRLRVYFGDVATAEGAGHGE